MRRGSRVVVSVVAVVVALGVVACTGEEPVVEATVAVPGTALEVSDVPGATSRTADKRIPTLTSCGGVEYAIQRSGGYARGSNPIRVEFEGGEAVFSEILVLDLVTEYPNARFENIARRIDRCDGTEIRSQYTLNGSTSYGTESFSVSRGLPDGVVGFVTVVREDDGDVRTVERVYAAVTSEGEHGPVPGIIVLTTVTPGDEPGAPAPLDLLDVALERAGATLDPSAAPTPTPTPTPTLAPAG